MSWRNRFDNSSSLGFLSDFSWRPVGNGTFGFLIWLLACNGNNLRHLGGLKFRLGSAAVFIAKDLDDLLAESLNGLAALDGNHTFKG